MRAMSAAATEMPVKPKTAATTEIRRNTKAHFNNDIAIHLPLSQRNESKWFVTQQPQ